MKQVYDFLDYYLNENDIVVCATSGGVDSMCLLHILKNYKKNIKIICAHINHNLRQESFEEYEFVKKYCNSNNIIFEGKVLDKIKSGNLEKEFRDKRYLFFDEIVKKYKAKYLFTAHHGDDLMETILMRIVRGSSIEGYAGFDKTSERDNYKILRPLIYLSKDELYLYATDNNIEYREDYTNKSDKYTRNRYRKYILPKLKEENKHVHLKFLKYSNELSESYNFINKYVLELYNKLYINNKLILSGVNEIDEYILKKLLYKILKNIYNTNISLIKDTNINSLLNIIKSNKQNLYINLPNDKIAVKEYNFLYITEKFDVENYKYEIKDEIKTPIGIIKKLDKTNLTNNFVCHLDSSMIKLPLYVRNRKDGDYIEILGLNGKKKVKDLFINEKIDKSIRNKYPIVVDASDNIVWIPGLKKSKYDSLKLKKYDIILWYKEEENNE